MAFFNKGLQPHKKDEEKFLAPLFNVHQQINEIFNHFLSDWKSSSSSTINNKFPSLDVCETETNILIKAELPGVNEENISIDVNKNQISIKGEKKSEIENETDQGAYWMKESFYGHFSRTLSFPFEIDTNKTEASFNNGLLTINIEKPQESVSNIKKILINK